MARARKRVVGLLGGVGSGKSTVAQILAELGADVIDADRLGHEVLQDPEVRRAISQRWGPQVCDPDGRIGRDRLGRAVFADPNDRSQLADLEAILHPRIAARMQEGLARVMACPETKLVVLDAPVLLEAGWDEFCDVLVYVEAPEAVRLGRVVQARGWDKEELNRRERMQKPLNLKKARADYEVDNSGSPEDCRHQVRRLFSDLSDD